jgi:hypothetical protein
MYQLLILDLKKLLNPKVLKGWPEFAVCDWRLPEIAMVL